MKINALRCSCVFFQCQAFDTIGSVCFSKHFNASADLHGDGAEACMAVERGGHLIWLTSSMDLALLMVIVFTGVHFILVACCRHERVWKARRAHMTRSPATIMH